MNPATAISAVSAVILAVATAFMGAATTAIWDQAVKLGQMDAKLDALQAASQKIDGRVASIDDRLTEREVDPMTLLARVGVNVQAEFVGVRVKDSLFILPKSEAALEGLLAGGYLEKQISPMIKAFEVVPAAKDRDG
ncbi:hypothetical protein [Methylopila turkensis]|uniref:Uncharacterized protein n=1 Tax=Methylopila turkensis TaxID=1437816 RepID=A0A9W6N744_9HYPH|nr:hypothetical protein [Methylopila turkensis]GLK80007.1 hypothetical protein GCM10008174_17480 [Methylopila turkensis]